MAGTVLVFLPAVGDFISAQLLGGPDTYMIGNLIQQQFYSADNWPFGSALTDRADGVPGDLHGLLPARRPGGGAAGGAGMSKGYDRPRFLVAITALVYVFLFAPIAVVVLFSFNGQRSLQVLDGFSLRGTASSSTTSELIDSLIASLEIAAVTTVVATILGTGLALGTVRSHSRTGGAVGLLLLIPLVTPEIVAGVSAFVLFAQLGVEAVAVRRSCWPTSPSRSPTSRVVVRGRLAAMGQELEEAALDLGATPWQAVRLVTLPALWPAILAAALIVFALSFDDFVLSFFTTGETPQPLPVRIYSALRFGISPTINAVGTVMMVVSALVHRARRRCCRASSGGGRAGSPS